MPRRFRGNSMNLSPQATTQLNSSMSSLPGGSSSGILIRPTALQNATLRIQALLGGRPVKSITPGTALLRARQSLESMMEEPLIGTDLGGTQPPINERLNLFRVPLE